MLSLFRPRPGSENGRRVGNERSSAVDKAEVRLETEDGPISITVKDLCGHVAVLGMTGSGKTVYLFNQILDGILSATKPYGQSGKAGFFLMDGKGDLARTLERLAPMHGRENDVVLFGPRSDHAMDPFARILEEDATVFAYMLIALQQALDEGKKSSDPFWEKMSLKLATAIFSLYKALAGFRAEGRTNIELEPMSFRLLNLLYLDRGVPRNQRDIMLAKEQRANLSAQAAQVAAMLRSSLDQICNTLEKIERFASAANSTPEADNAYSALLTTLRGDPGDPLGAGRENIVVLLEMLVEFLDKVSTEDWPRQQSSVVMDVCDHVRNRLSSVAVQIEHHEGSQEAANLLLQAGSLLRDLRSRIDAVVSFEIPKPEQGLLSSWIEEYERIIKDEGREVRMDPVLSFFREEYYAPDNAKMAGSVGATASNVTMLLSFPPFDRLFRPGGEFSFRKAIDDGLLVALDIDWEDSMDAALAMAIVCKYDFFRAALGRKPGKGVNLDRPFLYLCDEFAMMASKGRWNGEAAFVDKARGRKCPIVLSFQGFNTLESYGYSSVETKALLGNMTTKIFLRNDCPDTNRYASELFGKTVRAEGSIDVDPGRRHLYGDAHSASPDYRFSFRESELFAPDLFGKLANGEAVVKLPPSMPRRDKPVRFRLHPL